MDFMTLKIIMGMVLRIKREEGAAPSLQNSGKLFLLFPVP
jgi:hypothetical protein